MDLLRLAHPWVLAILPLAWAIFAWPVFRGGRRRPGAVGRAALASLAATLLVLALAAPSVRLTGPAPVCFVQDASPSMTASGGNAAAGTTLPLYAAALPDTEVEFFKAGGQAETDIAAALREAALALPARRGVLVLWTDGRETRGDAAAAASALAARGVTVHALLPPLEPPKDARVVAVEAPASAERGAAVPIRVRLAATRAMDADVRLVRLPAETAAEQTWTRRTHLEPDFAADLLFQDTPPCDGLHVYRAEVIAEGDAVAANNRAACAVRVGRPRTVLYVHSSPQPGPLLELLSRTAPVRPVAAHALPLPLPPDTSAVVLDNVSAWALGQEASDGLVQAVMRAGVGLLAVGGDAAFAAGGYADSPLEDALPVSSRTGRRSPMDLVLVVDASGSMNETTGGVRKLTLAKEAVLALRPALGEADRVAVVAFAGDVRVVSPLVPASDWDALRRGLLALEAGGGTRITPAVRRAVQLLPEPDAAETRVRHLVLLSDGRSEDFDVPALAALCALRQTSVSAVAAGEDADLERLGRLTTETGGRLYRPQDLARLAETFLADLAWARGEGLREEARPAGWLRPEPIWPGPGNALPPVPAYNETQPKEGADMQWAAGPLPRERRAIQAPLLATWRRGLGKVAAMPWPVGRAGDAWRADGRLARYLGEVLAWLRGPADPADWSARLAERDGRWCVRVEEVPSAIGPAPRRFTATVFQAGDRTAREAPLEAVGPGLYETDLGPVGAQAASVAVRADEEPDARAWLAVPGRAPREYERFGVDRERLAAIVGAGGGQIHSSVASLTQAVARAEAPYEKPVGAYLVWAAGAVVFLLVAGRLTGRL